MKNWIGLAALNLLVVTGYTATENANRPHNLPEPAVDSDYYDGNRLVRRELTDTTDTE